MRDAEQYGHFLMEESVAGSIRLHPFAVDDELRDGPFAGVGDDFLRRTGRGFDIDFGMGNVMALEKAFGFATVRAPGRRVHDQGHVSMINGGLDLGRGTFCLGRRLLEMVYLIAMTTSTEEANPFVFAVPLLRAQRIIALVSAGIFLLIAVYIEFRMGFYTFVYALIHEPFIWVLLGFLGIPIAIFLRLAYPPRRSLAKLEATHDSVRFVPAPFLNRFLGEPILEATISAQATEIVLRRDLRDKVTSTWSVSVLSNGEPDRSFKTTRLNVTTTEEGRKIVEGIGAATGLSVRMVNCRQTVNGAVEETPWTPPASQGKMVAVGPAILVIPYIGGAIVGYIFPRSSIILAVGFALWLFDLLAMSAFGRRSHPPTQNLGVHLVARFFMFWTGYGFAFVLVAYVLRGH